MTHYIVEESPFAHFFLSDVSSAPIWLAFRLYVGWLWFGMGWQKLYDPQWVGDSAGSALGTLTQQALERTSGTNPDVQGWYASFLQYGVLPHLVFWSHFIVWGELAIGVALVLGFLPASWRLPLSFSASASLWRGRRE